MKIFTCQICGEVYIGENIPPSCPFCGVAQKNVRLANAWEDKNDVELNETDKANVEKALELELSNTAFYKCAADKLDNQEVRLMFKGLFKVEREHADVYGKLLKLREMPAVTEDCPDDVSLCLEESLKREERAVAFYRSAAEMAESERVKEVFTEIMKVETDHVKLDNEMKEKLN